MTETRHYGSKVLIYSYATLAFYLLKFLLVPVLARNLGLEAYGIWSQISAAVDLLVPFCLLALPDAFVRFSADKTAKSEIAANYYTVLFFIIAMGALVSTLYLVMSGFISSNFIRAEGKVLALVQASSLVLFFSCLSQFTTNFFRTFQREFAYPLFQLFQAGCTILIFLVMLGQGYGLFQTILVLALMHSSIFLVGQFLIQKEIGWKLPNPKLLRMFLSYSLPLFPLSILDWFINVSDRYVIGYFLPITEVAKYSACYTVAMVIMLYYTPFYVFLSPKLVQLWQADDHLTLRKVLRYSNKFPLILGIPTVFGYAFLSNEILRLLTGENFFISPWIGPFICSGYIFYYIGWYYVQIFALSKRTKYTTVGYIVAAIVNLAGNIALVPQIGILGAAFSTMITFLAQMIYYIIRSRKFYDIQLKWDFLWKLLASSCIMLLSMILTKPLLSSFGDLGFLLLSIAVGSATYCACILLMGVIKTEEINLVKSLIRPG
ncbi:MAG: oligosaccharide flippase family protein [Ignavibacteriales bacterium]|nr:oligosaccharide flippase family protein [Ignavibacteriales bacterium]